MGEVQKVKNSIGRFIASMCCALALCSCASTVDRLSEQESSGTQIQTQDTLPETTTEQPKPEKLFFSESEITVDAATSRDLRTLLSVEPAGTLDVADVEWSIDGEGAELSGDGLINGLYDGKCTVTAAYEGLTAKIDVNIYAKLTGFSVEDAVLDLTHAPQAQLVWGFIPEKLSEEAVAEFSSDDPGIVSIDENGYMTAHAPGSTYVNVVCKEISAKAKVDVIIPAEGMIISAQDMTMYAGTDAAIACALYPDNTTDVLETVTYTSSDTNVCTVHNGVIHAVAPGNAVVKLAANGFEMSCNVFVPVRLEGIVFDTASVALTKGAQTNVHAVPVPANANEAFSISYASDNPGVATVDENGVVTAVGGGSCNIVAAAGEHVTAVAVNVSSPLESIYLNYAEAGLFTGGTLQLGVGFNPADTTDPRNITWATSDPNIATVDANGVVRGVSAGSCVVAAYCGDKGSACRIDVYTQAGGEGPNANGRYVVLLDPGHGGGDGGAHSQFTGANEKDLALAVGIYCRAYLLEHYSNVDVYMTRDTDTRLGAGQKADLTARVNMAQSVGANIMVSLHFNSASNGASGVLILPSKQPNVADRCAAIGNNILAQLCALGLVNQGFLYRSLAHDPNADYYFIPRECAGRGIPGIIIEHCFLDSPADVPFYDTPEDLVRMGYADAIGIANYLGLTPR